MCRKARAEQLQNPFWGHALQLVQKCQTLKSAVDCLAERKRGYDFKNGGRSRNRTYDLAHVRRADMDYKLLDLLAEILLEANAGDSCDS